MGPIDRPEELARPPDEPPAASIEDVVEDEPPTEALHALIRKVQGVFAGMT